MFISGKDIHSDAKIITYNAVSVIFLLSYYPV